MLFYSRCTVINVTAGMISMQGPLFWCCEQMVNACRISTVLMSTNQFYCSRYYCMYHTGVCVHWILYGLEYSTKGVIHYETYSTADYNMSQWSNEYSIELYSMRVLIGLQFPYCIVQLFCTQWLLHPFFLWTILSESATVRLQYDSVVYSLP